jgi:hypothetical protein
VAVRRLRKPPDSTKCLESGKLQGKSQCPREWGRRLCRYIVAEGQIGADGSIKPGAIGVVFLWIGVLVYRDKGEDND